MFKHQHYEAPTFVCQPCGCPYLSDSIPRNTERIDSSVVVDFREAIQKNYDWSPLLRLSTTNFATDRELEENIPICIWKDEAQQELEESKLEIPHYGGIVDLELSQAFESSDPLLKEDEYPAFTEGTGLREEDLILLPARVLAFVFRNRKFGQGLVVLLHGVPGVGKTSTAECVAESHGKPLFPITCGDLGLTAKSVERGLAEKFHLAQSWDRILLLDEADVFLAQRERGHIKRYALVSVFLRVLEYYTGILFLTTNRVGTFDDAFKSRIHLSLYFPPLEEKQTLRIWKMSLKRTLKRKNGLMTTDEKEILKFAKSQFQTAAALAEFDAQAQVPKQIVDSAFGPRVPFLSRLCTKHFHLVAEASLQFDLYINEIENTTLAARALDKSERNDEFEHIGTFYIEVAQPGVFRPSVSRKGLKVCDRDRDHNQRESRGTRQPEAKTTVSKRAQVGREVSDTYETQQLPQRDAPTSQRRKPKRTQSFSTQDAPISRSKKSSQYEQYATEVPKPKTSKQIESNSTPSSRKDAFVNNKRRQLAPQNPAEHPVTIGANGSDSVSESFSEVTSEEEGD